ncbi:MAG: polyphenol oxidase family protein [Deltaproteobacteria bacterium]|nr:polyphenol oxidase family protein [Deltaproteobacteria bacterium]MBW2361809.1 polyphenol oxidase family protein [Deltaproteobacteria bacterium]
MSAVLTDPLLASLVPAHGFGTRDALPPEPLVRPKQVHGDRVVDALVCRAAAQPPEADAIVSAESEFAIAVVTADCVPILLSAPDGAVVAALHAGWRGLAAGVVAAGVAALLARAGCSGAACLAAIGPHIGPCCYEVDEPVLAALDAGLGAPARAAARATRPGHARLDLGALCRAALRDACLPEAAIGTTAAVCTACDPRRFHSYRRDGPRSGRLVHFIRAAPRG